MQNKDNPEDFGLDIELTGNSDNSIQTDKDYRIFIRETIFQEIDAWSKEDVKNERGGIILGRYEENADQTDIWVTGWIAAKFTEANRGSVTFTHESWSYMHKVREQKYQGSKIVGWVHTHPGFGVFLSGYDQFIHQNFFNLPWQIAYVVDPVNNTQGFFRWQQNTIAGCSFFITDANDRVVREQLGEFRNGFPTVGKVALSKGQSAATPSKSRSKKTKGLLVAAAIVLVAAVGVGTLMTNRMGTQQASVNVAAEKPAASATDANNQASTVGASEYTVVAGDCLWNIAQKNYGNPLRWSDIARENQVDNYKQLQVGRKLKLPAK